MAYPNSRENATLQSRSTGLEARRADRIAGVIAATPEIPAVDVSNALPLAAWLGGALMATAAAVFALRRWRKWLNDRPKAGAGGYNDAFPLAAMDKLLADGQITPDEYRQLRRARLGLRAKKQPPADSGSSPPAADVDAQ